MRRRSWRGSSRDSSRTKMPSPSIKSCSSSRRRQRSARTRGAIAAMTTASSAWTCAPTPRSSPGARRCNKSNRFSCRAGWIPPRGTYSSVRDGFSVHSWRSDMYVNRNVLKILAGSLLLASLPAGAQALGGGLGGAAGGTLGGTLGGANINGAGAAAIGADFDASGSFGAVRDRAQQVGGKTRQVAGRAVGTARSGVESARGAADASVQTAHSASVNASHSVEADGAAQAGSASQASIQPSGGAQLSGSGGAGAEQHAMGRNVKAEGAAGSQTSADRSGLANSSDGQVGLSVNKDEPASSETPPAK